MYSSFWTNYWETAMIEQFGKSTVIILLKFIVFLKNSFFFLSILELDCCVFEYFHNKSFRLFFKKNIADTKDDSNSLKLSR